MERKITKFLSHWKSDENRKPLVIYGNKQVGKTYTLLEFGKDYYDNVVYFDADNNNELLTGIKKEKTIDSIIAFLKNISFEEIEKNNTLIVIDNVNDIDLLTSIRTFGMFKNDYHIVLITSLKDKLAKIKGEEFQFKILLPIDFEEYLCALGKEELIDFIKESFKKGIKMPFHKVAMEYYENYMITGGMPEAINNTLLEKDHVFLNPIFDKILDGYKKEMSVQENLIDIIRSYEVYNSVSDQLKKKNRKFQYGLIKDGGRSKEYENSLNFLHNNGFIYKCYKLLDIKSPLSSFKDKDNFKVYLNDTGLLYKKLNLNNSKLNSDSKSKEIMYENAVAIALINAGYSLHHYQSEGKLEIDFVIQTKSGNIIPIELVPYNKTKSKAMSLFMKKYKTIEAFRITGDNFCVKNKVRYIPIYATFCLSEII